jgi:ubiquinone biosynthesis accessory factor UbiK
MLNSKTLDELAARIGKAFEASPAKDIEKNVKAMLQSGLARLDFVTRQEFDIQAEVLRKTREKVERLEARVAELEARAPAPPQPMLCRRSAACVAHRVRDLAETRAQSIGIDRTDERVAAPQPVTSGVPAARSAWRLRPRSGGSPWRSRSFTAGR